MQKLLYTLLLVLLLPGCNIVHKMEIEQGNVITPQMLEQIHTGMTKKQVEEIMGTPILLNTFNDNRVDYVYTFKPAGGKMTEKSVVLTFNKGRLSSFSPL